MVVKVFKRDLRGQMRLNGRCLDMALGLMAFDGIPIHASVNFEYDEKKGCMVFRAKWEEE